MREVERAALQRDDALAGHRLAAVEQRAPSRRRGAARSCGIVGDVLLVGLREIGGVRVHLDAFARSQATAQRVSRPPEKAMPMRGPLRGK